MDSHERMTKSELVRAISENADVRPDVVRDVLSAFTNIAVEEIVNRGALQMDNLFRISNSEWAGYTAGGGREIPTHTRLSVKLPETLRTLYKHHKDSPDVVIDRDTWRDVLKEQMGQRREVRSDPQPRVGESVTGGTSSTTPTTVDPIDDFNPILDDYDE